MFQSTHSLRSATDALDAVLQVIEVSIHALLAECDAFSRLTPSKASGFNPRTPCGVRRNRTVRSTTTSGFQSTHSLRSATATVAPFMIPVVRFQSTHSLRSATEPDPDLSGEDRVSIHALLAECDSKKFYPRYF